jgi:hypothetical protein
MYFKNFVTLMLMLQIFFFAFVREEVFAGIFDSSTFNNSMELEENFELSEEEEDVKQGDQEDAKFFIPQIKEPTKVKDLSVGIAEIVALNKVTSKSEKFAIKIGEKAFFGNLEIVPYKCIKSSDPYNPMDKILIKIDEYKIDSDPENIFQGWILSTAPSLSGLNHPVYEVIAIECK